MGEVRAGVRWRRRGGMGGERFGMRQRTPLGARRARLGMGEGAANRVHIHKTH